MSKKQNAALWSAQGVLAAVFLFAGGMKLAMPVEMLGAMSPLPALFLKFVATCEVLGAAGLILPGVLKVQRQLMAYAAAGLATIMVGAVTTTVMFMDVPSAIMPFVVGILATVVAYGRRHARGSERRAVAIA